MMAPGPGDTEFEIDESKLRNETNVRTQNIENIPGVSFNQDNSQVSEINEDFTFSHEIYKGVLETEYQNTIRELQMLDSNWPKQSLFHGCVIGVKWNGGGGRYEQVDDNPDVDVGVGHTQDEALAAIVSSEYAEENVGVNDDQRHNLEELLAGFSQGLLSEMDAPDGFYEFLQSLHRGTFQSVNAGHFYDFVNEEMDTAGTPWQAPAFKNKNNELFSSKKAMKTGEGTRKGMLTKLPAPRYHISKDPCIVLTNTLSSTRYGGDGDFSDDGLLHCRLSYHAQSGYQQGNAGMLFYGWKILNDATCLTPQLPLHRGIPRECKYLVEEMALLDPDCHIGTEYQTFSAIQFLTKFSKHERLLFGDGASTSDTGEYIENLETYDSGGRIYFGELPSARAVNVWSQAWVPMFLDYELQYIPISEGWSLGEVDFLHTEDFPDVAESPDALTIKGRTFLSRSPGKIIASKIEEFLIEENELDEVQCGNLSNSDEQKIEQLALGYRTADILSATINGLNSKLSQEYLENPIRSGLMYISNLKIVDSFGRTKELAVLNPDNDEYPDVGLSMETSSDDFRFMIKPRIPRPARLMLRLISSEDDSQTSHSGTANMGTNAQTPVCAFFLPDHVEWAMEVFDNTGAAKGQLRVAERNWLLGGYQAGRLEWDSAPGTPTGVGEMPDSGNSHVDSLLQELVNQGLKDEIDGDEEGAFSALLRAIDTTFWDMDPFGKGGDEYPSYYMGRPVAVVRAKLWLDIDERTEPMPDALAKKIFEVRLGSLDKVTDGLLGYFVNDDYTKFHAVYPTDDDGVAEVPKLERRENDETVEEIRNPENPSGSWENAHSYLRFDPTIELRPSQEVMLTLLINPQASVHVTSGLLPQKEITLVRTHYEEAMQRIAPSFKVGPLLVDPSSVRMPIPDRRDLKWSWAYKPSYTEWDEQPIKPSDHLVNLRKTKPTAFEGWIKLDIDESQDD